ncbi:hypothetical protein B0T25DRAFT_553622 [Lasiosphaeria hispida]|uniref:Zn(2)-C6 fungal-type domain-containing protein n=1 Tax=Lasiosphaeria hispida TaxID=260671 RepID=A0AAJ0HD19_9PEZI|nr:hypothetical protein B0T25DRAFT_553622 [Lasiosphaeria hispida]
MDEICSGEDSETQPAEQAAPPADFSEFSEYDWGFLTSLAGPHTQLEEDLAGLLDSGDDLGTDFNLNSLSPHLSSINHELTPQTTVAIDSSSGDSLLEFLTPFGSLPGLLLGSSASFDRIDSLDRASISISASPALARSHAPQSPGSDSDSSQLITMTNEEAELNTASASDPIQTHASAQHSGLGPMSADAVPPCSVLGSISGRRTDRPCEAPSEPERAVNCFAAMRPLLPNPAPRDGSTNCPSAPHTVSSFLPKLGKRKQNTEAGSAKIKSVRRVGACLRCRIYRESCDENTPCGRCIAVSNTAKVFRQPCFREPLDSVIAFRAGNARAGRVRSEPMIPRWASDDPTARSVALFYPFKAANEDIGAIRLTVECRKFIPHEWDVLEEPWSLTTGEIVTLRSSAFACYGHDANLDAMSEYLKSTKEALLNESLDGISDDIIRLSAAEATRYCLKHEDSAVSLAMNIRAASYFSRTKMVIAGPNTLELPYHGDTRFLVCGGIPVLGILDYQIDYLAISYMLGQMKLLTQRLKKLIFSRDQKRAWYEVYLTTFVLLQSLETVHTRQIEILRRFETSGVDLLSQVRATGSRMIKEWEYSAKILIYHYRAILKGMVPFASSWDEGHAEEMRKQCGLDEEAIRYACRLSVVIKNRDELRQASQEDLDNSSAKPLVWISQLFMDGTE